MIFRCKTHSAEYLDLLKEVILQQSDRIAQLTKQLRDAEACVRYLSDKLKGLHAHD